MTYRAKRALAVGLGTAGTCSELVRLERKGWKLHAVETLRDAELAVKESLYEVILAAEQLSDGWGYDLMDSVIERAKSLLVMLNLSEGCLWLPVVERGVKTLGECALHPGTLEVAMEGVVSAIGGSRSREKTGRGASRVARGKSKRGRPSRCQPLWGGAIGMQPRQG